MTVLLPAKSKLRTAKKTKFNEISKVTVPSHVCLCVALAAKDPGRFRGTLNSAGEVVAIESSLTAPAHTRSADSDSAPCNGERSHLF